MGTFSYLEYLENEEQEIIKQKVLVILVVIVLFGKVSKIFSNNNI